MGLDMRFLGRKQQKKIYGAGNLSGMRGLAFFAAWWPLRGSPGARLKGAEKSRGGTEKQTQRLKPN